MENNEILVIYGNEYEKMTRELLEAADLAGRIGDRGKGSGSSPIWSLLFGPKRGDDASRSGGRAASISGREWIS